MYQSRKEDIDQRAAEFKEKLAELEKDYKYVDELLKNVYEPIKLIRLEKETGSQILFEFLYHSKSKNIVSEKTARSLDDTIASITKGTVNAVITFLEGHRELIIQQINNLTKENFKS